MTVAAPRTVFVSGIFNILHPGHVRLLRFASEIGDHLVVGVLADSLAGDVVTVDEASRLEAIQSLRMVDDSFIVRDSVNEVIARVKPEVVVKGREHRAANNPEEVVLLEQVFVMDGETKISAVIEAAAKEAGAPIKLTGFTKFVLGEGVEVEESDFAAEVAAAVNG